MRIEQLTFTRFIAAISIVIFHYGRTSFLFNNKMVSFIFEQANVGVSYFFILSGFVMTIVYYNRKGFNTRQYLVNRFARIYPLYIFAILLILIAELSNKMPFYELLLNVTMLQSWASNMALTLNYPGWSLSVEMFFYICFPAIFYLINKHSIKAIASSILLFWLGSQVIYHLILYSVIHLPYYTIDDMLYLPILHLNEFLIGIITGLAFLYTPTKGISDWLNTALITLLIGVIIIALKYPFGLNYHNGLLAILFAPLIYFISKNEGRIQKCFSKNMFVYLGEISFGVYLLQYPIWLFITDARLEKYFGVFRNGTDDTVGFCIRLVALILLSAFAYRFIENPLRDFIKKLSTTKYRQL
ncbi:acyltransferase family protein [Pontibacter sp. CAU 1760]